MASKELNEIRLANAMYLFEAFCEVIAPGAKDLRGLTKAFAEQLGIAPRIGRSGVVRIRMPAPAAAE